MSSGFSAPLMGTGRSPVKSATDITFKFSTSFGINPSFELLKGGPTPR